MIFLGGEVRVEDGYVFVRNESVASPARAREVLAAVDQALETGKSRAVMFDTRDMEAPPEEVNAILRAWVDLCLNHDKVALLVRSDLKRIASNMRALSVGVKMRSFHDRGEAVAWLRKPVPGRARTEPSSSGAEDDAIEPRDRTVTEPMDLPPPRVPAPPSRAQPSRSADSSDDEHPATRRWRSPLLQQLNED